MIGLWNGLLHLVPQIASYVVSFTVIAMYWTSHHALFHFFTKTVNRTFVQLNMLYLMLLDRTNHPLPCTPTLPKLAQAG